jgi:hypothetical protein
MALLRIARWDFKEDKAHFESLYHKTYEEFINLYSDDNIIIDLTGKIVVSLEAAHCYLNENLPVQLLTIFIPEEVKKKYKASLIYAGHIAFIKAEFNDGSNLYYYKDDECYPVDITRISELGDLLYCCEENGFTAEDVELQIEKCVQGIFDYRFKLDRNNLILLQGL